MKRGLDEIPFFVPDESIGPLTNAQKKKFGGQLRNAVGAQFRGCELPAALVSAYEVQNGGQLSRPRFVLSSTQREKRAPSFSHLNVVLHKEQYDYLQLARFQGISKAWNVPEKIFLLAQQDLSFIGLDFRDEEKRHAPPVVLVDCPRQKGDTTVRVIELAPDFESYVSALQTDDNVSEERQQKAAREADYKEKQAAELAARDPTNVVQNLAAAQSSGMFSFDAHSTYRDWLAEFYEGNLSPVEEQLDLLNLPVIQGDCIVQVGDHHKIKIKASAKGTVTLSSLMKQLLKTSIAEHIPSGYTSDLVLKEGSTYELN